MYKKTLKIIGLILLVIILLFAEIISVRGIFLLGSLVILYRAFTVLVCFFHCKKSSSEDLKDLLNIPWLIFCIAFLVSYPFNIWLTIVNARIPEGFYNVESTYHMYGENEVYDENTDSYTQKYIDESGIATFTIHLAYNDIYDEYSYYQGAVEFSGSTVSYETYVTVCSVDLPNYGEFYLDDEPFNNQGDCEIEIDYEDYYFKYDLGDLNEERLGYTLENKINNISTEQKIEFVLVSLSALLSIVGFFVALKSNFGKDKSLYPSS